MTTRYKTRAFVFKKNNVNESDRMYSVFTDDFGRLDIYAKAIRKTASKLRGGIDIFFMSEIEFIQGKNRKTLTDAIKIEKFNFVNEDLEDLKVAHQIANIMDDFIKGQEKDKETFELVNDFFCRMADGRLRIKNPALAFQYFFWNFISLQGYHLQVSDCAVCHGKLDPDDVYFSGGEGGVVCKNCASPAENYKKINSDIVKILRLIFKKDWQTVAKLKIDPSSQKMLEDILQNAKHAFSPVHN